MARQTPLGARPNRGAMGWLGPHPGVLLEPCGDAGSRGMVVHDRTRLNGRLRHFCPQACSCRSGFSREALSFCSAVHLPEPAPGRRPHPVIAFRAWETSCFHARAGHPWPACRNHWPRPTSTRMECGPDGKRGRSVSPWWCLLTRMCAIASPNGWCTAAAGRLRRLKSSSEPHPRRTRTTSGQVGPRKPCRATEQTCPSKQPALCA